MGFGQHVYGLQPLIDGGVLSKHLCLCETSKALQVTLRIFLKVSKSLDAFTKPL